MSLLSSVRTLSQDPHDWEEGLVIHAMAGMPASWCPISKQQMLFAQAQHSLVTGVLQMLLWFFFFVPCHDTINPWDRRYVLLSLLDWSWGSIPLCINLLCYPFPMLVRKALPTLSWPAVLLSLDHLPWFTWMQNIKGTMKYYLPASFWLPPRELCGWVWWDGKMRQLKIRCCFAFFQVQALKSSNFMLGFFFPL